jgi:hypothetical protein
MQVRRENFGKLCRRVSGHAAKVAIDFATPQDVSQVLDDLNIKHRVLDAQDPAVFDDKMPTIVSGMENLSATGLACLISHMDGLRFRDILVFPTKSWFEAQEGELTFWDRVNPAMREKVRNRLYIVDLEGF